MANALIAQMEDNKVYGENSGQHSAQLKNVHIAILD